jgi:hypothetical protein
LFEPGWIERIIFAGLQDNRFDAAADKLFDTLQNLPPVESISLKMTVVSVQTTIKTRIPAMIGKLDYPAKQNTISDVLFSYGIGEGIQFSDFGRFFQGKQIFKVTASRDIAVIHTSQNRL